MNLRTRTLHDPVREVMSAQDATSFALDLAENEGEVLARVVSTERESNGRWVITYEVR